MPTCTTIEQVFQLFDQKLPAKIQKTIGQLNFSGSVWKDLIAREPWLDGQGSTITYPRFERAYITGAIEFADIVAGEEGICQPNVGEIASFPSSTLSVTKRQWAAKGPKFCMPTLQDLPFLKLQLDNIVTQLASITDLIWEQTLQADYSNLAGHKLVTDADFTEGSSAFAVSAPTSQLTWGYLKKVYFDLTGFGGATPWGKGEFGEPIFLLATERETVENLKTNSKIEEQTRFAQMGNGVKGNIGLSTPGQLNVAIKGFKLQVLALPRHFNIVGGAWVEEKPFEVDPTITTGVGYKKSAAYMAAPYTESYVFVTDAVKHLVPRPASLPANFKYSAVQNWIGDFVFKSLPFDENCNLFEDKGMHVAKFVYAMRSDRPDLQFVIRHLRCEEDYGAVGCSQYA